MRSWSARSLANLRGIHPDLRRVMDRALQETSMDFTVIEGLRSEERQRQLVASGASQTMQSRHLTGHAVDLAPFDSTGKLSFAWPLYDVLGPEIKAAAQAEGVALDWGGDWTSFKDGPHFELDREAYPETAWTTAETAPVPKTRPDQTAEVRAGAGSLATIGTLLVTAITGTSGTAQIVLISIAGVLAIITLYLMRGRFDRFRAGDR